MTSREHAQEEDKNEPVAKRKVVFPFEHTKIIERLFSNEIGGKKLIMEENIVRTIDKFCNYLRDFTITQIVTKVQYEKTRSRIKK